MKKKIVLALCISVLLMSSICITVTSTGINKKDSAEIKKGETTLKEDPFSLKIKSRLFIVKYTIDPTSYCDGSSVYTGTWVLQIDGDEIADEVIPLNCNPDHAFTGGSGAFGFGFGNARAELKIFSGTNINGEPIQSLEKEGKWFFGMFFLH